MPFDQTINNDSKFSHISSGAASQHCLGDNTAMYPGTTLPNYHDNGQLPGLFHIR